MAVHRAEPELLTVRETAKRLGVHENTVRNWARDGILPTARVPGSRFHRFAARDVERLRRQRGATVSSVEQERRVIGPELVGGSQLSHWATTRDAQDTFPELVRRLLASTPGITNISIRSGEGVSAPGWDGRAESTGTAYLPSGSLCFEFGVGGQPKRKADEDYEKRRDALDGIAAAGSCFVFMTPRRWASAAEWASARRGEGVFSDVRVLDADDLDGWLQDTPAVHHWISEHLGRRPRDAETLERWWVRFQARTEPALPAALFLAGRDREREQLVEFLTGPPGVIAVQTTWRDEAIAFVCATIEMMGGEVGNTVQPPLIVSSAEVWDRVVAQLGRMTLLPLYESPDIVAAQERDHHVIFPIGRDQLVPGAKIELPRPDRQGAGDALEAAGIDPGQTYGLAALARRSMPSLVRRLARDPRIARPPWTRPPDGAILAPLVLVGGWTESEADWDVVSRMADDQRQVIDRTLLHWRTTEDPPFVRSSTQWHVASAEEAFRVLRDALTPTDLERWRRIATEVLLETDPQLELSPEGRLMADVEGVARRHSSVVRRGIAEGITLVGSVDDEQVMSDGVTGRDHARRIVRQILDRAARDASGRIWRSLADVLPLLAEAAPEEFLDAAHDDLDRDEPLLAMTFQDGDQTSWLYSSSPHTGLLWALESLCWSPEFLLDASRALARLHVIDSGGRLSNRPLASLQNILVGWIRHTAAPLGQRVRAVEQICRQMPDTGWYLVLALLPSPHAISSPPAAPRFRDWKPQSRNVSISEWIEYIGHLVRLAIALAGSDPERWAELGRYLGALPPVERDRLLGALETIADPESLDPEQRILLWEQLRKELVYHERSSANAESADESTLPRVREIVERLEPTTDVRRFAYLFDWHPNLPGVDLHDHEAYDAKLREVQTQAVLDTLGSASVEGLHKLAETSPVPSHLGWIVGAVSPEDLTPELLTWLDAENPKLREVAASWARRKLQDHGVAWLHQALAQPVMAQSGRHKALVLNAPARGDVWDALVEVDVNLADVYWENVVVWHVAPQDVARAARELLGHNRAWIAVDLLASAAQGNTEARTSVTPTLVENVLDAAMMTDPGDAQRQSLGYNIGRLLDYLEAQNCPIDKLTRYEFIFFRFLESHREPRALFAVLSNDPGIFVDLVSRVYRAKSAPRRQLSEQEEALARHAWWILNHWRHLPGHSEDESIDGEHLKRWVRDARLALADKDRADIGDEQIGQVLAASPRGADGIWPAEPVREVIEAIGSPSVETGVHVGAFNDRGVTSRGVYEGGQQERELAARYRRWAKQTAGEWPRTSRLLRGLAEGYEREARRADARAEISADTE